jgi:hypothetical protein
VESSYNVRARSSAGAVGLWQITKPAARRLLHIGRRADERQDPLKATHAAARILKANHASLGSWPLAITAYNHGPGGVARGVREVGSQDISELVSRYRGPAFGFASRNFYAEFLAALEVVSERQLHFGADPGGPAREVVGEPLSSAQHDPAPAPPADDHASGNSLAGLKTEVLAFTTADARGLGAAHLAALRRALDLPPDRAIEWFRWGPSLAPVGQAAHGSTWYTVWHTGPAGPLSETLVVATTGQVLQRVRWPERSAAGQ